MAPHKAIIELPRFIYARVPAPASAFVQTTTRLCSIGPAARTRWHIKPSLHYSNTSRKLSSVALRRQQSSSAQSPPPSPTSKYVSAASSKTTSSSAPLRHNGTYATAFQVARRTFATTRTNQKSHHFDTLKFVQRLKD